jgi:hypothetical protein
MGRLLRLLQTGRVDLERAFAMMETKEGGIIRPLITYG